MPIKNGEPPIFPWFSAREPWPVVARNDENRIRMLSSQLTNSFDQSLRCRQLFPIETPEFRRHLNAGVIIAVRSVPGKVDVIGGEHAVRLTIAPPPLLPDR